MHIAHSVKSLTLYIGSIRIYSRNSSGIIRVFFTINTICIADKNIFFVIIKHLFTTHSENSCCPHRTGFSVENNFVKILCSLSRLKYIYLNMKQRKYNRFGMQQITLCNYFKLVELKIKCDNSPIKNELEPNPPVYLSYLYIYTCRIYFGFIFIFFLLIYIKQLIVHVPQSLIKKTMINDS